MNTDKTKTKATAPIRACAAVGVVLSVFICVHLWLQFR
jgi:hypothetical protein